MLLLMTCLATFASGYQVLSKSETSVSGIKFDNNCGVIIKRTLTQPAVFCYVQFSETKNPELFYQSLLQLFHPYHKDMQLKLEGFQMYEQFYTDGCVTLGDV